MQSLHDGRERPELTAKPVETRDDEHRRVVLTGIGEQPLQGESCSAFAGEQPLTILTRDNHGFTYDGVSIPLHRYTPVETTVNAVEPALDYYWHVHDLAQDCEPGRYLECADDPAPERDSQ